MLTKMCDTLLRKMLQFCQTRWQLAAIDYMNCMACLGFPPLITRVQLDILFTALTQEISSLTLQEISLRADTADNI